MKTSSPNPVRLRPGRFHLRLRPSPRKLFVRLVLVLGLGWLVYVSAFPQLYAYYHAWQASQALETQDCARARPHLEKCVSVWESSAQRHFELARCCWREGDPEAAHKHLRMASKLGWPREAIDAEIILVDAQQGLTADLDALLADLVESAKKAKDAEFEALAVEAVVLAYRRGARFEEAAFLARTLVAANPKSWRAQWLLGHALEVKDPGLALLAYKESLARKPDQPYVHLWVGDFLVRYGHPQEALDHLRVYRSNQPDDAHAKLATARAHYLLGQWSEARSFLEPILARAGGKDARPLALWGLLELEEKGPQQAAVWLNKAESLAPFHPEVLDALAALAIRSGDTQRIEAMRQRKKEYQANVERLNVLRQQRSPLRQDPKASTEETQATDLQIASCLFQIGEDDAALHHLGQLLSVNPQDVDVHRSLADYFERVGAVTQAKDHRRRVQSEKGSE